MSRNYKFYNPDGVYFVSFATVEWLDVFTRNKYKDLLLESLEFSAKNKGMEIFAWCIMTNHIHLVFRTIEEHRPEVILGDFKRYTSREILKAITSSPRESRKEWLMERFRTAAGEKNYPFWRHDNKPIELWSNKVISEKIRYLHNNPVKEGLVARPHEYLYSSARDYAEEKGYLPGVIVVDT